MLDTTNLGNNLSEADLSQYARKIIEAADNDDPAEVERWLARMATLSESERDYLLTIIDEEKKSSYSTALDNVWQVDFERKPVSFDEWLEDPYYMGDLGNELWPLWKEEMRYICHPQSRITEWYITGAIGIGKTFVGLLATLYKGPYLCSCLKNPQKYFGLASDSEIVFGLFNAILDNATQIDFNQVARFVRKSGYFRDHCPVSITRGKIHWPTKDMTLKIGSSEMHTLGSNLFSYMIDEVNFMSTPEAKEDHEHQAYQIYHHASRRMKSRFQSYGMCPGLAVICSSRLAQSSFLEDLMESAQASKNPNVHISDYALWDTKGREKYSPVEFRVMIGNRQRRSEVLDEMDVSSGDPWKYEVEDEKAKPVPEGEQFIQVPADFYHDFMRDVDGSLRDIAGIPTFGVSPLIWRVESVAECRDEQRKHPFLSEFHELSMDRPEDNLIDFVHWNELTSIEKGARVPKYYPGEPRFIHCDLGLTGDAAAIAMGCAYDKYTVTEQDFNTGQVKEYFRPKIWVDFMLRIVPVRGEQIDLSKIVAFILNLRNYGFDLQRVTFDGFASEMAIQIIRKANQIPDRKRQGTKGKFDDRIDLEANLLSVDKDDKPYRMLRDNINQNAICYYRYDWFEKELFALEHDIEAKSGKGNVDHPVGGCFVAGTRIPLLDGTLPTIAELDGKEVWVYSSDENGRIVPGRARARMTKTTGSLVDVVLDSGALVRCTPDHPFRLRDGSYKEACKLVPGVDRLMPVNRTWPVNGGYERVTDKNGDRTLTHHAVDTYFHGTVPPGWVVHHRNGRKTDNRPENLERQPLRLHSEYHTAVRHAEDPSYTAKALRAMRGVTSTPEWSSKQADVMRRNMEGMDFKARARKSRLFRYDIDRAALERVRDASNANQASRILGCSRNVVMRVIKEEGFADWKEFQASQVGVNHKVREVIAVDSHPVPVYDLEVDEWSNFALACGVFVHNSKDVSDAVCGMCWGVTTAKQGLFEEPTKSMMGDNNSKTVEDVMISDITADYPDRHKVKALIPPPRPEPKSRKLQTGRRDWAAMLERFGKHRIGKA